MEPLWDGETKDGSDGQVHIIKMATMPNLVKTFSKSKETCYFYQVLKYCQSNDDPELTLTYFRARSTFASSGSIQHIQLFSLFNTSSVNRPEVSRSSSLLSQVQNLNKQSACAVIFLCAASN